MLPKTYKPYNWNQEVSKLYLLVDSSERFLEAKSRPLPAQTTDYQNSK